LLEGLEVRLVPDASPYDVLTFHNDNFRTGANTHETVLTPTIVNSAQFGRLFRYAVDGYVYAQPLYKYGLSIAGGTHNVLFVATEHDSVYALDADSPTAGPNHNGVYWQRGFIDPANRITTVPNQEVNTPDIVPEVGITGTPVIDATANVLYVVAKTKEIRHEGTQDVTHYVQRLHALDLTTGAERATVPIGDTTFIGGRYYDVTSVFVPGTGAGSVNGIVAFNALRELQRPGLALESGRVYVGFASHGDNGPYHGWVIAYTALPSGGGGTMSQYAVFNTSPDGGLDGIWQSGGAPAIDQNGQLIFSTGNGAFDKGLDGPRALGPTGGSLGYGIDYAATPTNPNPGVFYSQVPPITKSVAVKFDSFKSRPAETTISNSTGVYVNGHEPRNVNLQPGDVYQDLTNTGIDFLAGQPNTPHVFQVTLDYDGRTAGQEVLTETIVDKTALTSFRRSYYVNLSQYVGGDNAYVGFTAGTGGHNGKMDVLGWNYTDRLTGQQVHLSDRANLQTNGYASFLANGTAQLTDGGAGTGGQGESGSVFTKIQVGVRQFTTSFDFQMLPGTVSPPADGLTFTVQNSPGGPAGREVGESVVKVNPNQLQTGQQMTVADYFTPYNWRDLNIADNDLGSGATMLLPDAAGTTQHPHLAVETGKTGQIYLIDRDAMGGYTPQGPNANLQTVVLGGPGVWASPAYWNGFIYYQGTNTPLRAFAIANAMLSTTPMGEGKDSFPFPGAQPSISANGNDPHTGIAWTVDSSLRGERSPLGPAVLHAYRAVPDPNRPPNDRLQELWESDKLDPYATVQSPSQRDQAGNAVKFVVPTITNGHVYVGTQYELDVYGVFPDSGTPPSSAPVGLTGQALSPTAIQVSWQSNPPDATGVKIYRATLPDLSDATLVTQVGRDATSYTDTGLTPATTYYYYLVATNQHGNSPRSILVGIRTHIAPPVLSVTDVCPSAISLSWTQTGDNHYDLYRSTNGTTFTLVATLSSDQTSFADGGLKFGTYYYYLRAVTSDGETATSNQVGATIGPVNVDHSAAAGGFTNHADLKENGSATFGAGVANLTNNTNQAGSFWETSRVGVRGFMTQFEFQLREGSVPRADGLTFTLQADPRGITALGPAGGGLGYGADHPVQPPPATAVRKSVALKFDIYDNAGEGTNSTGIFADGRSPTVRDPSLPPNPTPTLPDISVNLDGTGINLNNQAPKRVTLTYDGTTLTETIVDEESMASYTVSYAVDIPAIIGSDTAYAGFTAGTGGLWTFFTVSTWTYTENETGLPPRAPSNLRQTGDPDQGVTLAWNCNNAYTAQGYYIERSTDPMTGFEQIAEIDDPNSNTYTDTPDAPGVYYYRVQSFNDAGTSAYSNIATMYFQVPAPPTNLRAPRVTANSVDLTWQINSTDQTGFQIERSIDPNGGFVVIDTVAADQNVYTDNEVGQESPGAYYYRVEALKDDYVSAATNVVRANVTANPFTDHRDIGAVAQQGNASYGEGIYTVQADGNDIWNDADEFHYYYRMFSGNGEIIARVVSVGNTDQWAKAGVMIRETLAANSRHAYMAVTPGNGAAMQGRGDNGTLINQNDGSTKAPYWVRLVRSGNTFTGYKSADGINWVQQGNPITMTNFAMDVYMGLAVTSHTEGALNTALFDNVLIIGAGMENAPTTSVVAIAPALFIHPVSSAGDLVHPMAPAGAPPTRPEAAWELRALAVGERPVSFGFAGANHDDTRLVAAHPRTDPDVVDQLFGSSDLGSL
jgi:hypothetical protein